MTKPSTIDVLSNVIASGGLKLPEPCPDLPGAHFKELLAKWGYPPGSSQYNKIVVILNGYVVIAEIYSEERKLFIERAPELKMAKKTLRDLSLIMPFLQSYLDEDIPPEIDIKELFRKALDRANEETADLRGQGKSPDPDAIEHGCMTSLACIMHRKARRYERVLKPHQITKLIRLAFPRKEWKTNTVSQYIERHTR